ncbi:YdcF family protein [Pseudohoeflea coraliihabitans]|uniref:YdcF family protein n=1 Tax=Pseudohoeflea coraliihabitans TaxID=2860393 RepID=A0ABS6WKQ3_9HYPH|nr:YdcF family protein [Pseudohoeflea sp. DP4N28-3]MBW3096523.1 YdcF family protein [Pseudohoeflea sp. DP4N28-3]
MSYETVHEPPLPRTSTGPARRLRRGGRYTLFVLIALLAALLLATMVGFFRFTERVAHLPLPVDITSNEAIVALTGGYQRIDKALELLEDGVGQRLLISGVNPATSGAAIKKATGASERLFDCCVDIGYQAIDTIGNANEAANWIRKNGYRRVLVVTNNYHMPRSLLELAAVSPEVEFTGYPVSHTDLRTEDWISDPMAIQTLLTEYFKYALAQLRSLTGAVAGDGLRADLPEAGPAVTASLLRPQ